VCPQHTGRPRQNWPDRFRISSGGNTDGDAQPIPPRWRRRDTGSHRFRANNRLQQRVAGKAISPVQPGAGDLAARPQARERATSVLIDGDAPHVVMGGRSHRDRLHRGINSDLRTDSGDHRKMLGKLAPERGSGIEEYTVAVGQVVPDRARHDVTRGKLTARHADHKARPRFVDQCRALATHCFADQRQRMTSGIERRRVELDKLQVNQSGPGPRRNCQTLAKRSPRVRGVEEQPADAAGRQHDTAGGQQHRTECRCRQHAADHAVNDHQSTYFEIFQQCDRGCLPHRSRKRPHDLSAGAIASGMNNPASSVRRLPAQAYCSSRTTVKAYPVLQQRFDSGRPGCGDLFGDVGITQAVACGERIREVKFGIVIWPYGGGDASLRPGAGGLGLQCSLGEHNDRHRRQAQSRHKPRDAAADDHRGPADMACDRGHGAHVRPTISSGRRPRSSSGELIATSILICSR
jgi:hypothetical protein